MSTSKLFTAHTSHFTTLLTTHTSHYTTLLTTHTSHFTALTTPTTNITSRLKSILGKLFRRKKPQPTTEEQQLEQPKEPEPAPPKPEERFILAIDGGGMRGIIPVIILQHLETYLRQFGATDDIATYFDLIAGTSTGGIIALALTQNSSIRHIPKGDFDQVDLQDLLNNYLTMGDQIFQDTTLGSLRKLFDSKYKATGIQIQCQKWFGTTPMDRAKVPTLILAYNLSTGQPELIRSYTLTNTTNPSALDTSTTFPNDITYSNETPADLPTSTLPHETATSDTLYPVWVAARATSAAPTYFPPIQYAGSLLVDGGVIANNPSIFAYLEAKRLYPNCQKFHILSISTGGSYHTMDKDDASGILNWAGQMTPMFSTAQKRTTDCVMQNMDNVQYVRIDHPLTHEIKMDETSPNALSYLQCQAEIIAQTYSTQLQSFAQKLISTKPDRTPFSHTKLLDTAKTNSPTKPLDPTETNSPTNLLDPTKTHSSTKPLDPTETNSPTNLLDPTKTHSPTKPLDPTETNSTTNAFTPTKTHSPTNPLGTTKTNSPTNPFAPAETNSPTNQTLDITNKQNQNLKGPTYAP